MDRQTEDGFNSYQMHNGCSPSYQQPPLTPRDLTLIDLDQQQINSITATVPEGASNVQDIYPLLSQQEGFLFHHLLDPEKDAYFMSALIELPRSINIDQFMCAVEAVIKRHDSLRTAILWESLPRPIQVVCRRAPTPMVERLPLEPGRDSIEQLKERMKQIDVWDLRRSPLLRIQVATQPNDINWYALLHVHHIVCDYGSLNVLAEEVIQHLADAVDALPDPISYRDHVAQILSRSCELADEDFFRRKLSGFNEPTAPYGLLDVYGDGSQLRESTEVVNPDLSIRIRDHAKKLRISAARLFHAAFALVVSRTSHHHDVVFGTVLLATQQRSDSSRRAFGMFSNTLPLRLNLRGLTATDLVHQTQKELGELLIHKQAPLPLAQRASDIPPTVPLFVTVFNFRRVAPNRDADSTQPPRARVIATGEARANYPTGLTVDDSGSDFTIRAQTARNVDPSRLGGYLRTAMESLLTALEQEPQLPALSLEILPKDERLQLIELFNAASVSHSPHSFVHEAVDEFANTAPDNVAVIYEGDHLTYAELSYKSNQLARYLRRKGVVPNQLVAICAERSVDTLVGLLGILKAGGAYLPLDPLYPAERLVYMLQDAAPKLLLIHAHLRETLPAVPCEMVALDGDWNEIAMECKGNLDLSASGLRDSHLAYVIYTSGSSGRPKGVMVEHRNLLTSTLARTQFYGICPHFLLVSSIAFDSSIAGIFGALTTGGRLNIAPSSSLRDPDHLLKMIEQNRITDLLCIPSLYHAILCSMSAPESIESLARVIVAGEVCPASLLVMSAERAPHIQVFNEYGPTEATVWATVCECGVASPESNVPIGRPVANTRIYILDAQLRPVPIGVIGEIYIGGSGVARGYMNRADLTADRFIPDLFNTTSPSRIYRTGDLGRWRNDGRIEYAGRNDDQVKIRGYRVELREIEAQLVTHPQVDQAIAMIRSDNSSESRLVAYLTLKTPSRPNATLTSELLRAHMRVALPEHSIPGAFVFLDHFPVTPNGKIDRRALPAPDKSAYSSRHFEAPQGVVEETLGQIWAALLNVKSVGRQDNFFELGGHSLLATRVISRLREELRIELPVKAVFDAPTLKQLAERAEGEGQTESRQSQHANSLARDLREQISGMDDSTVLTRIAELERDLGESAQSRDQA